LFADIVPYLRRKQWRFPISLRWNIWIDYCCWNP